MAHRKQIKVSSSESWVSKRRKTESGDSAKPLNASEDTNLPYTSAATGAVADITAVDDNTDKCHKCFTEVNDQWIMCDSCDLWFHRKCAA